nr:DNA cytosine methyltransferase [Aeromonas salmonicida]
MFAGCGGLSLGLSQAGWQGFFAIERSPLAFETLRYNLIDGNKYQFNWPNWLPKRAMTCEELLENHTDSLKKISGNIELIVGGPPCQGFSTAGKRNPDDPRNRMAEQYIKVVEIIKPRFLVIENVAGFNMKFDKANNNENPMKVSEKAPYAAYIKERLQKLGYSVSSGIINCADFGVPQNRNRFIMICEKTNDRFYSNNYIQALLELRSEFLLKKGLPLNRPITTYEAISDLETKKNVLIENTDSKFKKHLQILYKQVTPPNPYQKLMYHDDNCYLVNSLRIPIHKKETISYFKYIQKMFPPGKCLNKKDRELLGSKKHSLTILHREKPSPTITTLPDDILHYDEPRILTVRENARIQSFPDWFEFHGKYTTGGKNRKLECPRYTQVGNAVPPLASEIIGLLVLRCLYGN